MYCRKCGKEISNVSKFCPYCGYKIKSMKNPVSNNTDILNLRKVSMRKRRRKGILSVVVGGGCVIIGVVAILGIQFIHNKSPETKIDFVQNQEIQLEKTHPMMEAEDSVIDQSDTNQTMEAVKESGMDQKDEENLYPKPIELSEDVKNKLSEFLWVLGNVDCKMCGGNVGQGIKIQEETYITYSFLYMTLYKAIPFVDGETIDPQSIGNYTWVISEEAVAHYLKNTINSTDYLYMQDSNFPPVKLENGMVYVAGFDPDSMWNVKEPVINSVIALSESEIELKGTMPYKYMYDSINSNFDVVLIVNTDSMWGYALKEIKHWGIEGEYILPDVASRNYTADELSAMDAHTLFLARNEIYARHGYIFNNQELKDYFGGMSWYIERTTVVPDTEFNEYEKSNLEIVRALEIKLNEN